MRSGELREKVRVERRGSAGDGYGNSEGPFAALFSGTSLPARVRPGSARSDAVVAARLQGVNAYDVMLRHDSYSVQITADDRLVWLRPEGELVLQIRGAPVDPTGLRRELHVLCEAGEAT